MAMAVSDLVLLNTLMRVSPVNLLLVVENLVMIKTEMIKVGKAWLEHCPPL